MMRKRMKYFKLFLITSFEVKPIKLTHFQWCWCKITANGIPFFSVLKKVETASPTGNMWQIYKRINRCDKIGSEIYGYILSAAAFVASHFEI